ncbi:SDR family NAD(P)-dependent oxidoreductase [Noviherbaspirillum sedimenti]|uniref:SDR family oxidoreductase n=1 Tax=Noviherbaspirillum sedimenti TaxID=2320865 RepID=A0A3A3G494_9BURK|nr:SDR family oxidoreductase [Noviherbaspirillum sedimenti]RJG03313.1 SDR family oxidoreductase [Noviherbaspirillum sedimenti]
MEDVRLTESTRAETPAWLDLAGRVCVVTGGGRGIGEGTARELAANGASVAVLDRDGDAAARVADEIKRAGGRAISLAADVSRTDQIAAAAERVLQEFGPCQVLVNNAALVGYAGPLMDADLDQWDRMQAVNVKGALICTRTFGRQMIDAGRGGSIVNVASICGHTPLPQGGAYSVGKAGLLMLTRMLALELAEHRVRCNSVSPGLVRTSATESAYVDPEVSEGRRRMVPAGRVADSVDLANVIAFLASDRAGYVNGQDILVDGALSQTLMTLVPKPSRPMQPS